MVSIIKETFTGTDLSITNHEVNSFSNSFQHTLSFLLATKLIRVLH